MKVDMQKPIPGKKRVSRGKTDEKGRITDILPVPVDDKPTEVVQRNRYREGTSRHMNDLETKADELEKLYAEHKARSASARRRRPAAELPSGEGLSSSSGFESRTAPTARDEDCSPGSMLAGDLEYSDNSKGKHYDKYMQLRDSKLGEERRSSKGAVKDAQLKAMEEQLEHFRSLLEAGLGASSSSNRKDRDLQGPAKLDTQGARATTIQNKQQVSESSMSGVGQDDTDGLGLGRETDQDRDVSEMPSQSSRAQSSIYFLSITNATSSVPGLSTTTSAKPIPTSTAKPISSSQGRLRTTSEKQIAQSAPTTFYRKENGIRNGKTKHTIKSNYKHNKSASGGKINFAQDDTAAKQRKSSASGAAVGQNDLASETPDDSMAAAVPLEKPEFKRAAIQGVEPRPFLRKGKGIGPGAGPAAMAKLKASIPQENLENKDQPEGCPVEAEPPSEQFDYKEEDLRTESAEEPSGVPSDDGENSRGSPGSGDVDVLGQSPFQPQNTSLPTIATTTKGSSSSGSPLESSRTSWDSDLQHSFAYAPRASDAEAFVDSPADSSVSGSFRHSDQNIGSDVAAWTRTEPGMAHDKPVLPGGTPRRAKANVAKGWKRLLKFGKKKSKVGEGGMLINDWASSSANSGVGDNIEDSCDQGSQISDASHNSGIGLSQYRSACADTNSGEISNAQAPRSFFFLPSFKSKGSKARTLIS